MLLIMKRNAEPIPGYRLLEPLGRGGFGEVWKCEAPGGLFKAIKFVRGDTLSVGRDPAHDEMQALQRIKALRHPFLLSIERIEVLGNLLVIVTELADKSLQDVLTANRRTGLPGIPRAELLRYLREAADVLDLLNLGHDLQHLDIKPANLFLVSDHVKLGDFGLVQSRADLAAERATACAPGAITPRYAAPELFRGALSPTSDQYSLAVVYQELLTGVMPFRGKNSRQLAVQHTHEAPDLTPLSAADAEVIGRALAKKPSERFPTCLAMVEALEAAGRPAVTVAGEPLPAPGAAPPGGGAPRPPGVKYLPDYEFLKQLARTPTAEVWAARSKEGARKQVKFLYGVLGPSAAGPDALARLQQIRHPGLPATEVLPGEPGCVIVVTDLLETSLRDRFQECRKQGAKGLLRRQLLDWLGTAAETLDELARQYQLQHLALSPRNLLLDGERLVIGDFGLEALLWQECALSDTQVQNRYAAPELLRGRVSPHCDQYSLAVIYQELLTGAHPLRGGRRRPPNPDALEGAERAAVARALDADPDKRFASCGELLWALEEAATGVRILRPTTLFVARAPGGGQREALVRLVERAAAAAPPPEPPAWLASPGGGPVLEGRFAASLPPQGAEAKFEGFRQQWNAQLQEAADGALTYHLRVSTRFWQRWFGRAPAVVVEVRWTRAQPPLHTSPQVVVRVRADDAGRQAESLLKEVGPLILDSIGALLRGQADRRRQERVVWAHPVLATFVMPDGQRGETVEGQGKDISLDGMGLYLPRVLPGTRLDLSLPLGEGEPPVSLAGNFVRVQRCGDGWFEAGVLFE